MQSIPEATSEVYITYESLKNIKIADPYNDEIASVANQNPNLIESMPTQAPIKEPVKAEPVEQTILPPSGPMELDTFRLELVVNDTFLSIEAENLENGKFYKKELTNDAIENLTSRWFTSTGEIYENLQLGIQKIDDNVRINISPDAVIKLSLKTVFGTKEKFMEFNIELEEQNLTPLEVCQKYLGKLQEENNTKPFNKQLLRLLPKLLDHNMQVEKELEQIKERIAVLENKLKDKKEQE